MIKRILLQAFCLGIALTGCGRDPGVVKDSVTNDPPPAHKVTLLVFGAGYCEVCKSKFPEISTMIQALPPGTQSSVDLRVFVTAGNPPSEHPTQAMADAYRDTHLPGAKAYPDEWRWKNFRKYITTKMEVPAAVVLDDKGTVLKTYTAGDTTFVPRQIVDFVVAKIPPPVQRAQLLVFGAGYCEVCKSKFPEMSAMMKALPAGTQGNIDVKVYVTAGNPPSEHPTQAMADAYRDSHFPGAKALPDEWRWKVFRKYITSKMEVPAAVVLDEKGALLKVYTAGDTTFVPRQIIDFVSSKVSSY